MSLLLTWNKKECVWQNDTTSVILRLSKIVGHYDEFRSKNATLLYTFLAFFVHRKICVFIIFIYDEVSNFRQSETVTGGPKLSVELCGN